MPEGSEPELPRGVALAWGVAANPQRGPKREMSIERIVEEAVKLADAGGLGAVSMASVAAALGFSSMSLYRYVTAKDDLILLMQEQAIGAPPESILDADRWRPAMRAWADATLAMYREHPWLLDVPIEGTPVTPANLAWLDVALHVMDSTPISDDERLGIVLAITGQIRWQSTVERGAIQAARQTGRSVDEIDSGGASILDALVTAVEFPFVRRAIDEGAFLPTPGGDPFDFGLERVLDGIEAYIAAAPARPAPRPPLADPIGDEAERDPKYKETVKARREVEKHLREARKKERETLRAARERIERRADR